MTGALLDAIVERNLDIHSIGDFFSPAEIVDVTTDWRQLGLPQNFIAFASDGCGNKFCFDGLALQTDSSAASVWFFDHDFGDVEAIAPSFKAWIDAFCSVQP